MSIADLEFRVELWDDRDLYMVEIIAASGSLLVARAAFAEALKHRPARILRLRHRRGLFASMCLPNWRMYYLRRQSTPIPRFAQPAFSA